MAQRKQLLEVPEGGSIDHRLKTVDVDTWAESGGSIGIYAKRGYRPA